MSSSFTSELLELRSRIDEIDGRIIGLFAQRFAATAKVGALKANSGIAAVDVSREENQRTQYANLAAKHGLSEALIQTIFQAVISEVVSNHVALSSKAAE